LCARDVGRRQASGDGSNIKREETIDAAKYAVQPQAQDGPHALRSAYPSDSGVGAPHIRDRNYWMGYSSIQGLQAREPAAVERTRGREERGAVEQPGRTPGGLADTAREQHDRPGISGETGRAEHTDGCADGGLGDNNRPGPTNGFWSAADWLGCRDGKWRPVEPGTFPLADGITSRVGRLRAYGNAINAEAARIFIQSVMELLNSSAGREFAA
jgi:DNA (cytosine-5)-methyltransferase 1